MQNVVLNNGNSAIINEFGDAMEVIREYLSEELADFVAEEMQKLEEEKCKLREQLADYIVDVQNYREDIKNKELALSEIKETAAELIDNFGEMKRLDRECIVASLYDICWRAEEVN